MNQAKYIGMDVHQATISVAVLDSAGKLIMECILETKASTILQFMQGLDGSFFVTFEEGTCAAWLHDLLKPHVTKALVCDPRKNALLKEGSKNDRIDARKLAELLRNNLLSAVYHGENGVRTLKELARSYLTITKDLTRVMNRIKALYRSWAIPYGGRTVYAPRHRSEWLAKIREPGVRLRAERLYQQLDALEPLRRRSPTRGNCVGVGPTQIQSVESVLTTGTGDAGIDRPMALAYSEANSRLSGYCSFSSRSNLCASAF
jgi:transposase